MLPYSIVRQSQYGKQQTNYMFAYDAKNGLSREFLREAEALLSIKKQDQFHIFIGTPSGLRINVAPQDFNSTSIMEIADVIRNTFASFFVNSEGKKKLTVQFKHTTNNDENIVYTLSYHPEADE